MPHAGADLSCLARTSLCGSMTWLLPMELKLYCPEPTRVCRAERRSILPVSPADVATSTSKIWFPGRGVGFGVPDHAVDTVDLGSAAQAFVLSVPGVPNGPSRRYYSWTQRAGPALLQAEMPQESRLRQSAKLGEEAEANILTTCRQQEGISAKLERHTD